MTERTIPLKDYITEEWGGVTAFAEACGRSRNWVYKLIARGATVHECQIFAPVHNGPDLRVVENKCTKKVYSEPKTCTMGTTETNKGE
jgi:hypothetical protein